MLSIAMGLAPMGYFGAAVAPAPAARCTTVMKKDVGRYMYDEPYAPAGMGREYINAPDVRKPLSEFVGASEEFNLAAYFAGEKEFEPWDPWDFAKLSKVSANNPDVAFLREAELKHGRIAMLAFVGIFFTAGDVHFGASPFADAAAGGWPEALGSIQKSSPGIFFQGLGAIAIVEGVSNSNRGKGCEVNWWDGLWLGERAPAEGFTKSIVAGDLEWDPLGLKPKDPEAYKLMQLKELKNGRLAMLAVMGIFSGYLNTGADPFK
jgi:light-harvesting complex I chlorophyll a/b binding protein 1